MSGVVDALAVVQRGLSACLAGVPVRPGVEADSASSLPVVIVQEVSAVPVRNADARLGQVVTFGVSVLAGSRAECRRLANEAVEAVLVMGEVGSQEGGAWVSSSDWDALPVEVGSQLVADNTFQMSGVARFRLRH